MSQQCLNCEQELPEGASFCPHCGQKTSSLKLPARELLPELYDIFVGLSQKAFRDLYILTFQPGRLSYNYNIGKRTAHLHPLKLFLFTLTLSFFYIKQAGFAYSETEQHQLDFFFNNFHYFAIFFLLPLCVLVLKLLNPKFWLSEHVVFALNSSTRLLLFSMLCSTVAFVPKESTFLALFILFVILAATLHLLYSLYKSLHMMYGNGFWRALFGMLVLSFVLFGMFFFSLVFAFIDPSLAVD